MTSQPTAAEVARAVADALEAHDVPYAIGGALALGFYSAPRATIDVDVNLFIDPASADLDHALRVLAEIGFQLDETIEQARARALKDAQLRGHLSGIRIDIFVPAIPFYAEMQERRQPVELLGQPIWVIGPEDLAILKLMFFRRKDLADVEAMLSDQGSCIDREMIRNRLVDVVGLDDERIAALDQIVIDVAARPESQ